MKIAIIGSGFYGCSLAIILSKKNQVDVYEKEKDIFNGASSCNQFRYHSIYDSILNTKYGKEFWEGLINFNKFVEWGVISPQDLELFKMVDTVEEALASLIEQIGETNRRLS